MLSTAHNTQQLLLLLAGLLLLSCCCCCFICQVTPALQLTQPLAKQW
jgi:hypothetical protein